MNNLNKYLTPIIILAIFILYLIKLSDFPIFADEAIYLNWADRVITGQENPFISMYDGKPPLYIWLVGLTNKLFPSLLFSGRFVSVLSIISFAIFLYLYFKKTKQQSLIFYSIILVLTSPFIFFHARLGLMDTLLSVLIISAIVYWSENKSKYQGLITGILLSLAFWTKTPAMFLIPFPLISTFLFNRNKKTFIQALISTLVFILGIIILKISIWFPSLFNRSADFTYSIMDIISGRQTDHFYNNFKTIVLWIGIYQSYFIFILFILGLYIGFKKNNLFIKNLFLNILFFTSFFTIFGKTLTPRYYYPIVFSLLLISAYAISQFSKKLRIILLSIILVFNLSKDYQIIFKPLSIKLPVQDEDQYLKSWASGIGIREVTEFIVREAEKGKIKVLTEGSFGTLPDGIFVLLKNAPNKQNMEIIGVGSPQSAEFYKQLNNSKTNNIYYVGNKNRIEDSQREKMELINSYQKKDDGFPLELYKIDKTIYGI